MKRLTSILAGFAITLCALSLAAEAFQFDTNATTTASQYTPQLPGEVLIGKTGSTDTVWIAKGNTSNDWVGFTISLGGLSTLALSGGTFGTAAIGTATISTNLNVAGASTTATLRVTGATTLSGAVTFGSTAAATTFTVGTNAGILRVDFINGTNKLVYVNGAVTNILDQDIAL